MSLNRLLLRPLTSTTRLHSSFSMILAGGFLRFLARLLARETSFLFQRLSVTLQRFMLFYYNSLLATYCTD